MELSEGERKELTAYGSFVRDYGLYINQSRLSSFMSCEVLYELQYEFLGGLVPKQTRLALSFGSAYHDGIAQYYTSGRDLSQAVHSATDMLAKIRDKAHLIAGEQAEWEEAVTTLIIMLGNYHARFGGEAINVLAPEVKGVVRIGNSKHHLVFRADALFERYNRLVLLESKTKKRTPGGSEITKIHTDIQPTTYLYASRKATGQDITDVQYRWAIKRPDYDKSKMFIEEVTSRSMRDLARFEEQAIAICERIMELRATRAYIHNWNQCTMYGECDMRRICLHHRDPAVLELYEPRGFDYVDEAAS